MLAPAFLVVDWLLERMVDPMDRRSALVQRTLKGQAFLRDLRGIMVKATASRQSRRPGTKRCRAKCWESVSLPEPDVWTR